MGLGAALERAEDNDARVVVIRGRGHTFCAGADLNMLDSEFLGTTNNSVKIAQVSARTFDRAFNLGKPTIAGRRRLRGGGRVRARDFVCDFAIAADDARIGDFHIRRALFGGAGPIHRLPRYIGLPRPRSALHRQASLRQAVRRVGPRPIFSTLDPQLDQAIADSVADDRQKRFTMRITKLTANRGLDGGAETLIALENMTTATSPASPKRQRRRTSIPREARPRLEAPLNDDAGRGSRTRDTHQGLRWMTKNESISSSGFSPSWTSRVRAEERFRSEAASARPWATPPGLEELKVEALPARSVERLPAADPRVRCRPDESQYALLVQITGRTQRITPKAISCSASNTGISASRSVLPRRPSTPPVIRPLLTSPRRAAPSRAPPSLPNPASTPSVTGHPRTPAEISASKTSNLHTHPPRLRNGPLMTSGFASWCRLARTAPPSTRSPPDPSPGPVRHVFLGSRLALRLPPHPASRLSGCHRLVVGAINLHRGLAPPSCWSCRAHRTVRDSLPSYGSCRSAFRCRRSLPMRK